MTKIIKIKSLPSDTHYQTSVAILIAAYNEEKVIGEKIDSILRSNYPPELIRIYIGSDASTDRTNAIIAEFSIKHNNISLIEFSGRTGKSAIINKLATIAHEEIFILTDANVIFTEETIPQLIRHFENKQVRQVCANILKVSESDHKIQPIEKIYLNRENRIKQAESYLWNIVIGAEGGCYAIRKENYLPVPKNFFMDDFYITMGVIDQGGQVLFEEKAICNEDVPSESSEEFKRKVRISIGNFQNLSTYKHLLWPFWKGVGFAFLSHKVLRWLTPFFLLVIYICSLALSLHSRLFLILTIIQLIFLAMPLFIRYLYHVKPLLYIAHFYNMNYALLKGFIIFMKGVNSNVWQPTKRHA